MLPPSRTGGGSETGEPRKRCLPSGGRPAEHHGPQREPIEEHAGTIEAAVKSHGYDNLYRLSRETVSGALAYENTFTYDAVGNRLTQTKTGVVAINYAYDERDRLLSEFLQAYTWDANGNLVTKAAEATYTWDYDDRLV